MLARVSFSNENLPEKFRVSFLVYDTIIHAKTLNVFSDTDDYFAVFQFLKHTYYPNDVEIKKISRFFIE